MGTQIFKKAFLSIGGTELSTKAIDAVTLSFETEVQDDTHMGDDTRKNSAGLKNWSVGVELTADFGVGGAEDAIWSLFDAGAPVAIVLRPSTDAVGASNPQYSATGIITNYQPFGGSVGEQAKGSFQLVPGGASANMARATS